MHTYVFLLRFVGDSSYTYRRFDVKAMSAASAHARFYEQFSWTRVLENGTFLVMAELSAIGSLVLISREMKLVNDEHSVIC